MTAKLRQWQIRPSPAQSFSLERKKSSLVVKPVIGSLDGHRNTSGAIRTQSALSGPEIRKLLSWLQPPICSFPGPTGSRTARPHAAGSAWLGFPLYLAGCKDVKLGGMFLRTGWGRCSRGNVSVGCMSFCFWMGAQSVSARHCYFLQGPTHV